MLRAIVLILSLLATAALAPQLLGAPPASRATAGDGAQAQIYGRRTALVIGNGTYKSAPLPNPVRDVRLVAASLSTAHFNVTKLENATREQMLTAITEFGDEIEKGGVGVFYYAGHGVQVRGENYLIPVDAKIDREEEIRTRAVNAQEVLDRMGNANNQLNLVFLDACRNDPFPRRTRTASQGLAKMDAALGTLISFATAPGSVADDGTGANSPYSRYLAESIKIPGLRIEDVLKRVRTRVREETKGRQVTWDNSSIEGDFFFLPRAESAPAAAATPRTDDGAGAEVDFWSSVQASGNPRDLELYLQRYPSGQFAELARRRLEPLRSATSSRPPEQRKAPMPPETTSPALTELAAARPSTPTKSGDRLLPKAGDEWTYRFRSNWANVGERVFVHRVAAVTEGGIQETMNLQGATGAGDARAFDSALAVAERHAAGVVVYELAPYLQAFTKLEPGMQLPAVTLGQSDATLGGWTAHARVAGREKVRTPAGEFDALRIEVQANRTPVGGVTAIQTQPARIKHVIWYAPATKRIVMHKRAVFSGNGGLLDDDTVELLSYQLH